MEFGVNKCSVLTMKRGRKIESSVVLLPSGDKLGDPAGGGYKCLGILENDKILARGMKEHVTALYKKILKLLLQTKLNINWSTQ